MVQKRGEEKKILFVLCSLPQGGAERQAIYLVKGLSDAGYEVELCLYSNQTTFYHKLLNDYNLQVVQNKNSSKFSKITFLISRIRSFKPSIVITFLPHNGFIVRLLKCLGIISVPIIYGIRNTYRTRLSFNYIVDTILGKFSVNIHNSNSSLGQSRSRNSDLYIPNGFEEKWSNIEKSAPTPGVKKFALIGRITQQKNHLSVVHALKAVRARGYKNFKVYFYGDTSDERYCALLREAIGRSGLSGKVKILGKSDDIGEVYASVDCVLIASVHEGCPNVLFEALLSKTLVLISKKANQGNFVCDKSSLIYENSYQLEKFLEEIIKGKSFKCLIEKGYRLATTEYSLEKMIGAYANVVERLLK